MKEHHRSLFLLDNPFVYDKRVYLEAKSLVAEGHEVNLIAVAEDPLPTEEIKGGIGVYRLFDRGFNDIKKPGWYGRHAEMLCKKFDFDVVHAHDHAMLHLGVQIKKHRPDVILIYDSHELFHEWPVNLHDGKDLWLKTKTYAVRKLEILREKKNGKYIDRLITVNESLAKILEKYFSLKNPALALRNLPERADIPESSNVLREIFSIPENQKIIVYFGKNVYLRSLNIEQVLEEFSDEPDVAFVFIAAKNAVAREVMDYVTDKGYRNVYFHDLIPPEHIQRYLSSADIGLVATWNKNDKSYWLALGNKIFDYIRAGIPLLITAQPEYKRIIDEYGCGRAVNPDQPGAYRKGFREIIEDYDTCRNKCLVAASELCWEKEESKLIKLYGSL